jgi:hypothetical protein
MMKFCLSSPLFLSDLLANSLGHFGAFWLGHLWRAKLVALPCLINCAGAKTTSCLEKQPFGPKMQTQAGFLA